MKFGVALSGTEGHFLQGSIPNVALKKLLSKLIKPAIRDESRNSWGKSAVAAKTGLTPWIEVSWRSLNNEQR